MFTKSSQCNGGLYCFSMETNEIKSVLENMTDSCKEIKKVAKFNDTLVFTDIEARQVKRYDPSTGPRKLILLLEMEVKEGRMEPKQVAVSFKCMAFVVFQIHFSQRMQRQGKSS